MSHRPQRKFPPWFLVLTALVILGLLVVFRPATPAPGQVTPDATLPRPFRSTGTAPAVRATATRVPGTPTRTPTPTVTPTPTLDLARCNAAGCGAQAARLPTAELVFDLLLTEKTPARRRCPECPRNPQLSEAELNRLVAADPATLARLRTIALSQTAYKLTPGVVYIVYKNVHHVVVDLQEQGGYVLRNIIPEYVPRGTLITPSYCLSPKSIVVVDADYHGLNGSNKTETGRDLFFHLGRAALFKMGDRYNIGVIRSRARWDRTSISWGGGPIFLWDGRYNYNPEKEWFEPDALEHYRLKHWTKVTVAVSKERKYLFISASYGLTLQQHAENIIELGQKWGIKVDRAMRFDGSESGYVALRLGENMVPILNLEEPLIVNCLAIETP